MTISWGYHDDIMYHMSIYVHTWMLTTKQNETSSSLKSTHFWHLLPLEVETFMGSQAASHLNEQRFRKIQTTAKRKQVGKFVNLYGWIFIQSSDIWCIMHQHAAGPVQEVPRLLLGGRAQLPRYRSMTTWSWQNVSSLVGPGSRPL